MDGRMLRATLAADLPGRVGAVLGAYDAFAGSPVPDDAKGFAAHHAACKAALAHADLLVRLLKWAEGGAVPTAGSGAEGEGAEALLARARAALGQAEDAAADTDDDVDEDTGEDAEEAEDDDTD